MPFCKKCAPGDFNDDFNQVACKKCPVGFFSPRGSTTSANCTEQRRPCSLLPPICGEHGHCEESGQTTYSCHCLDGWYGAHCEFSSADCRSAPCMNFGTCIVENFRVVCKCLSMFSGEFCENYVDPCSLKNCSNNGVCLEVDGRALCECGQNFEGDNCEIFRDFCQNSPCLRGSCENTDGQYQCLCPEGWIGKRCHLKPCDYIPCHANAICVDSVAKNGTKTDKSSFQCECPKGFKGVNCTEIDDPCDSSPCRNNGRCQPIARMQRQTVFTAFLDDPMQYKCQCRDFFYGKNCEIFVTPDFIMDFKKTDINNYIKMNGPSEDLYEVRTETKVPFIRFFFSDFSLRLDLNK